METAGNGGPGGVGALVDELNVSGPFPHYFLSVIITHLFFHSQNHRASFLLISFATLAFIIHLSDLRWCRQEVADETDPTH